MYSIVICIYICIYYNCVPVFNCVIYYLTAKFRAFLCTEYRIFLFRRKRNNNCFPYCRCSVLEQCIIIQNVGTLDCRPLSIFSLRSTKACKTLAHAQSALSFYRASSAFYFLRWQNLFLHDFSVPSKDAEHVDNNVQCNWAMSIRRKLLSLCVHKFGACWACAVFTSWRISDHLTNSNFSFPYYVSQTVPNSQALSSKTF
jgi:hypothetical protein